MSIRILIADDHAVFRSGLRLLLEKEADFTVVGEAATGPDALTAVAGTPVDLIILDLSLPGLSGQQVAETLRREHPQVVIVVLTMHEDEHYLRELLRIGARGFVLKQSTATDLVQAIRTTHRGERYVDPMLAARLLSLGSGETLEPGERRQLDALTPREQEICGLLAYGHTNAEIARRLEISERTVETHRASILGKLNLKTRAELVRFAIDTGLLRFP